MEDSLSSYWDKRTQVTITNVCQGLKNFQIMLRTVEKTEFQFSFSTHEKGDDDCIVLRTVLPENCCKDSAMAFTERMVCQDYALAPLYLPSKHVETHLNLVLLTSANELLGRPHKQAQNIFQFPVILQHIWKWLYAPHNYCENYQLSSTWKEPKNKKGRGYCSDRTRGD